MNETKSIMQRRLDWALAEAERVAAKLAVLEQFGDDEYEEGCVLRFNKTFRPGGTDYAYAMIKCNGLWYSTGPRAPKGFTWEAMINWLTEGPVATYEIWMVSEYTRVS